MAVQNIISRLNTEFYIYINIDAISQSASTTITATTTPYHHVYKIYTDMSWVVVMSEVIWFVHHTKMRDTHLISTHKMHTIVALHCCYGKHTNNIHNTHSTHTQQRAMQTQKQKTKIQFSKHRWASRNFCEFEKKNIVEIDVCKMNKIYTIPQYGKKNWPFVWVSKSINLPRSGVWLQLNIADNAQCDPIFMYVQIFLFSRSA